MFTSTTNVKVSYITNASNTIPLDRSSFPSRSTNRVAPFFELSKRKLGSVTILWIVRSSFVHIFMLINALHELNCFYNSIEKDNDRSCDLFICLICL